MTLYRLTLCLCLLGTLLVSCSGGGGGGSSSLAIINSVHGIDGATGAIVINERWIVFLADEATTGTAPGSDLNGDGDIYDRMVCVIDAVTRRKTYIPFHTGGSYDLFGGRVLIAAGEWESGWTDLNGDAVDHASASEYFDQVARDQTFTVGP